MTLKKPTTIHLQKMRAVPLKAALGHTDLDFSLDYTLSYRKGIPVPIPAETTSDTVKEVLRALTLAAFSKAGGNMLSYKYKRGDHTFFEVTVLEKKVRKRFAFITKEERV